MRGCTSFFLFVFFVFCHLVCTCTVCQKNRRKWPGGVHWRSHLYAGLFGSWSFGCGQCVFRSFCHARGRRSRGPGTRRERTGQKEGRTTAKRGLSTFVAETIFQRDAREPSPFVFQRTRSRPDWNEVSLCAVCVRLVLGTFFVRKPVG